jgi:hypothetical protein
LTAQREYNEEMLEELKSLQTEIDALSKQFEKKVNTFVQLE